MPSIIQQMPFTQIFSFNNKIFSNRIAAYFDNPFKFQAPIPFQTPTLLTLSMRGLQGFCSIIFRIPDKLTGGSETRDFSSGLIPCQNR